MASTRSWAPTELTAALAAAARELGPARHIAVAVSGGRDSIALLHALAVRAPTQPWRLSAIHVHHGLSAHADAWARFCADQASELGIPFRLCRVAVARTPRSSLEEEARVARYTALDAAARDLGADTVALAHHADDQAETVLLQLLRGAGPAGLAAMPRLRERNGLRWWRPLLDLPRTLVERHVQQHALRYSEDDSNASARFRRNALRMDVVPALRTMAPGYPATLVRSAALQAEAAQLLDDLAALDAATAARDGTLARAALAALPPPRARNLLRWFLRQHGLRPPSRARLEAIFAQVITARSDAQVRIAHDGAELGLHAGRLHVHAPAPAPFAWRWEGQPTLALPHGQLAFTARAPDDASPGLALDRLAAGRVMVRSRNGGERLRLHVDGPPRGRALKTLLHAAGIPAWERAGLPLLTCNDHVVAVAGIGIDVAFRALPGAPALAMTWTPAGLHRHGANGSSPGPAD
jgi:tRNA(Ile)-lysidine synthase